MPNTTTTTRAAIHITITTVAALGTPENQMKGDQGFNDYNNAKAQQCVTLYLENQHNSVWSENLQHVLNRFILSLPRAQNTQNSQLNAADLERYCTVVLDEKAPDILSSISPYY